MFWRRKKEMFDELDRIESLFNKGFGTCIKVSISKNGQPVVQRVDYGDTDYDISSASDFKKYKPEKAEEDPIQKPKRKLENKKLSMRDEMLNDIQSTLGR